MNDGFEIHKKSRLFLTTSIWACSSHQDLTGLMLLKSVQSSKSLHMIRMLQSKCLNLPPDVLFEIFDTVIVPTVTYTSEIWGYKVYNLIENVQIKFCRQFLGVGSQTPNVAVLGKCGRFPLFVIYYTKCVKYWLKLLTTENGELPKSAYNMSLALCEVGKINWVSHVKNLLFRYGFGFAFEYQKVGDQKQFLCLFKQRLKDNYVQGWTTSTNETYKLKF